MISAGILPGDVFEKFCQNIVPPADIFGIIGVYERCFEVAGGP